MGLLFVICSLFISPAGAQTGAQTKYIQGVDEYVPAPGQFVNTLPEADETDTPQTMADKCTARLAAGAGGLVTLGAYGGYITFHFDHPVANVAGQKDFAVWGNAFENNAEPAIVMVSVDVNGNGLPDDAWYELKGSEYDNAATTHGYELTYTYAGPKEDVGWTDNQGQTGVVARNGYHTQEYFPLWLTADATLTFRGARLPNNASLVNGMFLLHAYDYGYADNLPNDDIDGCSMDIGWAVDASGQAVSLTHVDFVRCYNAMNQACGWIGETSTEITGAEDLHLEASLAAAEERAGISAVGRPSPDARYYDLQGRRRPALGHGLNLVRRADGSIRKVNHQ